MATPTKKQNVVLSTGLLLLVWLLQYFGIVDLSEFLPNNDKNQPVIEEKAKDYNEDKNDFPSSNSKTIEELDQKKENTSNSPQAKTKTKTQSKPKTKTPPPNTVNGQLLSERLIYTRHAKCRMGCRYISEDEVAYILRNGKVNKRKSKPYDAPCPTYALEGVTPDDRQEVRIVFAACDDVTKVITTIDLGNKYQCHCD